MKSSLRSVLGIILLIAAAAATLSSRLMLSAAPFSHLAPPAAARPRLNATLLSFAAADPGEDSLRQIIKQLEDADFRPRGTRQRSFLSHGRHVINVRVRSSRGLSLNIRSPQDYRLWLEFRQKLQDWARKRRFQDDVMEDLVDLVKGVVREKDSVLGSGRKYRTCAVVGNSGILLNDNLGEEIDSHEFVIRLNNARTTSYERNVGSKTSLSFINSNILNLCARRQGCFCHPYGEDVPLLMYVCQPAHLLDYTVCGKSHKAPLVITDPRFDVMCARIVKYYSVKRFVDETGKSPEEWGAIHDGVNFHYSSGMQAVMLAVGICDKVSIFGFGKSSSAKHHYHTNQKAELGLHDYLAEYELYGDLATRPEEGHGWRVVLGEGPFLFFVLRILFCSKGN